MKIVMLGEVPLPEEYKNYSTNYKMSVQHYYSPWIVNLLYGLNKILDDNDELHLICNKICLKKEIHFKDGKIYYHFLPMPRSLPKLWFLECYIRRRRNLMRLINKINPDIVHCHGTEREYGITTVSSNYPSLLTIHGLLNEVYKNNEGIYGFRNKVNVTIRKQFEKITLRKAKNFIFITPWVEEVIRSEYTVKNSFNIFNPIAFDFFNAQKKWGSSNIIYIGRISPVKGLTDLIRAMGIVVGNDSKITLDIYGHSDGDYAVHVNDFIKQNNLSSHIKIHGFISNDKLPEILSTAEIFVLPSFMENCPMVILEAMATGTPVISTKQGGIPYLIKDGISGLLYDYGDYKALAHLIDKILSDQDLKYRLGSNACEFAKENFHPVKVAERHYEAYKTIIENKRRNT
jgi:glycosyltransferase involved in cell wall biosynthesis